MPTLTTYRQALAQELGWRLTASTSAAAVGPDATRWLIVQRWATAPLLAAGAPMLPWVHILSGTQINTARRVVHRAPELGAALVDQVYSATVASGVTLDLLWPLPPSRWHGVIGLVDIINLALGDLWVPDRLDKVTTTAQTYSFSDQAAWLDREDRILRSEECPSGIYDPARAVSHPPSPSRIRWRWVFDSGTPTLQAIDRGYGTAGFTFQVAVKRPASTLISGAESTAGLSAEADTALPETAEVVTVGLLYAYRWLSGWSELATEERARYAAMVEPQEAKARRLMRYLPRDVVAEEAA